MILPVLLTTLTLLTALATRGAESSTGRVWEVNGVRLEAGQVEKLARDIARQTVAAVQRLEGVRLEATQATALEGIYRTVAVDVYDAAVKIIGRRDLDDASKERAIIDRVLQGQRRSSEQVAEVLDSNQYAVYRRWEQEQVDAFKQRGLWSRGKRARRRRR